MASSALDKWKERTRQAQKPAETKLSAWEKRVTQAQKENNAVKAKEKAQQTALTRANENAERVLPKNDPLTVSAVKNSARYTNQKKDEPVSAVELTNPRATTAAERKAEKAPISDRAKKTAEIRKAIDTTPAQSRVGKGVQSVLLSPFAAMEYLVEAAKQTAENQRENAASAGKQDYAAAVSEFNRVRKLYTEDSAEYQKALRDLELAQQGDTSQYLDTAVDPNSRASRFMGGVQQLQEDALEGTSGAGRFLGETALSIGSNLSKLPLNAILPGASLALMGAEAAAGKAYELQQQGVGAGEALGRGVISGGIEALTEKIPLDNLMDIIKTGGKTGLMNLVKQAATEAGEEGVAYLLNLGADKVAGDPEAEFVWNDFVRSMGMGALSGGILGGGATAINRAAAAAVGKNYQDVAPELIAEGLELGRDTDAFRTASEMQRKVDAGKNLSNVDVGRMVQDNEAAMTSLRQAAMEMAEEEIRAREQAQEAAVARNMGYGNEGTKTFSKELGTNRTDAETLVEQYDKAYQSGLIGARSEGMSGVQLSAYAAGKADRDAQRARDLSAKPAAVYSRQESGFDFTNAPSDITERQRNFGNLMAKTFGIKGNFVEGETDYNARYVSQAGVVNFAKDFGIDQQLMQKLGDMDFQQKVEQLANKRQQSFAFYVAHEIADHVAANRAPAEMRAFNNAMYGYLRETEGANLARERMAFYSAHGKQLDTKGAIEEVAADSILMLYDGDEQKFMTAMERVLNGTDEQAKQGAKTWGEALKNIIEKLKAWARKLTGRDNAKAKADVEKSVAELERLRDMFEAAIAKAAKNVEMARGLENRSGQEYNGSETKHSMKEGKQDGREENQGNEETGREAEHDAQGAGTVQRAVPRVYGKEDEVVRHPEKGERPVISWKSGEIITPAKGTVAFDEVQKVESYNVSCFVIQDAAWDAYWADAKKIPPAFANSGQVYLRATIPADVRGMVAPHELTHVMKQAGYQPYLDVINRTLKYLDQQSVYTQQMLIDAAEQKGLVLKPKMARQDIVDWYDEFHANLYGEIAANTTGDVRWVLDQVFRDFDAYAAEMTELHRQFKASQNGEMNSLKGEQQMANELKRIREEGRKAGKSEQEIRADVAQVVEPEYAELLKTYGAIKTGETPARDVSVPEKTGKNRKVSQTVRTILEAEATPEEMVPDVQALVAEGALSFESYTDEQAIADATAKLTDKGWSKTFSNWLRDMDKGIVSKENTVTGWALYNNAANSGDTETALTILEKMVGHQRNAAQALQATRVLKKLSPETQLYGVQRSIEDLQEELNERYGDDKAPKLKVDPELGEKFLKAKTDRERDDALKEIYHDVGRQMPSTFKDKWNAWRYLAMLGNPRTHVRNIVGNAGFAPLVAAKNLTATAIESVVSRASGGKIGRTKALIGTGKSDRALLKAAWEDYTNVADVVSNGGKYSELQSEKQQIREGQVIFKNKALEKARVFNSKMLEKEDVWFSQPHYAAALASYCKANGIKPEQIAKGGKLADKARAYAIKEAQKATYKDTNQLSQVFGEIGKRWRTDKQNGLKRAVGIGIEGVLPFRKTPANILARGLEYSPVGLMNGVKKAVVDVQKGDVTAAEAIDNIAAGLTGTGLLAFGVFLAAQGLVRGRGEDDEKEREFAELQGHQAYSLELPNGTSVTLDWLAPEALPFFIGVNLYEMTTGKKEEISAESIIGAVGSVTEPLLEMSCLQSLNDLLDSVSYAGSNELSSTMAVLASAATSYLTQAIPTLGGQIERTSQDVRMSTYTDKNNRWVPKDLQYTLGKATSRIPGVDYGQIPYIDAWGRTESTGSRAQNAFENFLNPAYTDRIETSDMEEELKRLYQTDAAEGKNIFPTGAKRYVGSGDTRKDLTAEEYVQYATKKGQTAYGILTELVESGLYAEASDEDRASIVDKTLTLASQTARAAVQEDFSPDSWVRAAMDADTVGLNEGDVILYRLALEMADDNSSISQDDAVAAIGMLEGLSKAQKAYLWQTTNTGWKEKNNPWK